MNDSHEVRSLLSDRLQSVEDRIRAACQRVGRSREQVTLIAVTKTITAEDAAALPGLGILDLGENRPQELWRKAALLPSTVRWHLIGHLQRNKIERTLPLVRMIHSVDSVRLLEELEKQAKDPIDAMLEVNASGEASKQGFAPDEIAALVQTIQPLQRVRVRGLMTMAALEDDPERCRPTFRLLRELRDSLAKRLEPPHQLDQLSMGMSNDFEVAIEEGATLVRIGTALFG
jgi:pyridoxal phosphate enzyme (YggS family)